MPSLSVSITSMHLATKALALGLTASMLLAGCSSKQPDLPETYESQVGIQLFMWNWDSIANECAFLGASGVDWVLTSPPQEHVQGETWWTSYQPVSYQIESKLGSREQFATMVSTCAESGVDIIADAVINHMAGTESGVGTAGTFFNKYEYPGLYSAEDFHNCGLTWNNQIEDYQERDQVQTCELVGLSDLDQSSVHVQENILGYLNDLLLLGVKGFRIDAAKHIAATELAALIAQLPEGTRVLSEVIQGAGEPIQAAEYQGFGEVFEFDYAKTIKGMFQEQYIAAAADPTRFDYFAPSSQSAIFVSNHDTERNNQTLNYHSAKDFELATALMLAENYGQPVLYSSFAFDNYDAGPNLLNSMVQNASCAGVTGPKTEYDNGEWICQQHWQSTVNMIQFHKQTSGLEIANRFEDSEVYGFSKADRGYFITNVSADASMNIEVETGLPDGEYQNLFEPGSYRVEGGILKATMKPKSAIALLVTN